MSATDWTLLEDYCAATGTSARTVDAGVLSRFVAFTMGRSVTRPRRVRALLRQLVQVGAPVEHPDPPPLEPWWKPVGMPLSEVLARIDPTGWPGGFRRCRDGFILTVAAAGLSRRQVQGLSGADLRVRIGTVTVAGIDVPEAAEAPAGCGRCAMTRWLRVLAAVTAGGRADVQPLVAGPGLLRWHRSNHDCRTPLPTSWGEAWALLPAIDVHGWPDDSQPVSLRTLTTVMSYWRSSRPPVVVVPDEPDEPVPDTSQYAELGWDELDEVVDRVCAEADEVLARVNQLDWRSPPSGERRAL